MSISHRKAARHRFVHARQLTVASAPVDSVDHDAEDPRALSWPTT